MHTFQFACLNTEDRFHGLQVNVHYISYSLFVSVDCTAALCMYFVISLNFCVIQMLCVKFVIISF